MKGRIVGLLGMFALVIGMGAGQTREADPDSTPTLWILPQTHWEGAVFQSREDYLQLGLPHILMEDNEEPRRRILFRHRPTLRATNGA